MTEREFELSRRDLLRYAAQARRSSNREPGRPEPPAYREIERHDRGVARVKRGGTLQAGLSGGSSSDTLDPQNW